MAPVLPVSERRESWTWHLQFKSYIFTYYIFKCFKYMTALSTCMPVHDMFAVPAEARKGYQMPWNWSYRRLLSTMWILGREPGSSKRTANGLNGWVCPTQGKFLFYFKKTLPFLQATNADSQLCGRASDRATCGGKTIRLATLEGCGPLQQKVMAQFMAGRACSGDASQGGWPGCTDRGQGQRT